MFRERHRPRSNLMTTSDDSSRQANGKNHYQEAGCLYALITNKRPVSRRNRASWYLNQLNKVIKCDSPANINSDQEDETTIDGQPPPKQPTSDEDMTASESVTPAEQETKPAGPDIKLISVTTNPAAATAKQLDDESLPVASEPTGGQHYLVTPNTRVLYLSRSIATSIILDLSPSVVSVSSQSECVFLDSIFDALRRVLNFLVKDHEIPSSAQNGTNLEPPVLCPKVFVSVIAYTPFIVAKNNQVLVQNRSISSLNVGQVLVEIWVCLERLIREIYELVSSTCGTSLECDNSRGSDTTFIFPSSRLNTSGVIRQPGAVLEDIFELGLFSSSLMPRLSRLSVIIISDGLFSTSNNLSTFRLRSIAISFISLGAEFAQPNACFGYTPDVDLMRFISKTTLGVYLSHMNLINISNSISKNKQIPLLCNPLGKLFCWTLHSESTTNDQDQFCDTPRLTNSMTSSNDYRTTSSQQIDISPEHVAKFFCVDQPLDSILQYFGRDPVESNIFNGDLKSYSDYARNLHDWRLFKQLDRNLDADFEQVLACLLREGYLIKSIQFKQKETAKIVAKLVLHWRHNLDLEQELTASYWNNTDSFELNEGNQLIKLKPFNTPLYGDTYCELFVHGSYSFLHNLYCDRKLRRRSEYRDVSYRQYRQLIDGVMQTQNRLQYLSRFYRDSSLSKVPSYLLHGNSLFYEQPHTRKLTSTFEIVTDESKSNEFQEYWQEISCLDTRSWKNLMHIHTLRLVLEHDQPKHKNIHYQNANGRYTHVQCRRALSSISNFIKNYSSFALLEDSTYIKFIYNKDDDLREIETSATKGFIVIRIHKLLPIVVIYLMFTSGILDSNRIQIVSYLEDQLVNCKLKNMRQTSTIQIDNVLKSKTISPSGESCCVIIKSPLERMLKVYSRNFVADFLSHNLAHGLPGSCSYPLSQTIQHGSNSSDINQPTKSSSKIDSGISSTRESLEGYAPDNSLNQYNLVFGKYLYGVRTVQSIYNLPNDIITSLASNVLSKISAILVNIRIKEGFHIAFNNSGILNLVVELSMKDPSNEDRASSCLCQYIVFPPTVTGNNINVQANLNNILSNSFGGNTVSGGSIPGSLSGSLGNSDSYMKNNNNADLSTNIKSNKGEIKIIKEYWIEQQYGISSESEAYHKSLQNKRYSELVDHLFKSDISIFECLLTYDLLQLMCDKLSLYYDLDLTLATDELKASPLFSPTTSTTSSSILDQQDSATSNGLCLPSKLIEGNTKDGNSKVPLLEMEYKFSVTKFLKHCQQASLNVLMFQDHSEFFEPVKIGEQDETYNDLNERNPTCATNNKLSFNLRKLSVDGNGETSATEVEHGKREHRSSYQHDNLSCYTYSAPIYSPSLNHLFLETLHKRLKQMHDKELKLSEYDLQRLPIYLKRKITATNGLRDNTDDEDLNECFNSMKFGTTQKNSETIGWRCFLRKGNQENLMIVLILATLDDITRWLNFLESDIVSNEASNIKNCDPVCPLFVFRCSSTMINDHVMSFLKANDIDETKVDLESDISLHFGQPCKYMGKLLAYNDELNNEIPLIKYSTISNQTVSDEKTLEIVHFRAFLRKIKNTVLKSRFSSLNDAYLSELSIHKDDILYYINNVDADTQKKYHVNSQLKGLADFIKSYQDYSDSLPKEPAKPCNPLLNSILLQKCGLFINQPIARFDETNPLIKQLHDKKLLYLMRCNYKIELPLLEENLVGSNSLRKFIQPNLTFAHDPTQANNQLLSSSNLNESSSSLLATGPSLSTNTAAPTNSVNGGTTISTSLGRNDGARYMEMKCGSVGTPGSPSSFFMDRPKFQQQLQPRFGGSNTAINNVHSSINDSVILEAFRGLKSCSINEVDMSDIDSVDISARHEAHMAEVLTRTSERKESHHYRRVLKSKGNYNQSHGAIDRALKRVDSLGRLEHFCLTPLLFSPEWRSKLAPVRDHTIETSSRDSFDNNHSKQIDNLSLNQQSVLSPNRLQQSAAQQEADEKWHAQVCNNYIKEYEQYIQTLGFNSVQIRYQSSTSSNIAANNTQQSSNSDLVKQQRQTTSTNLSGQSPKTTSTRSSFSSPTKLKRGSLSTSNGSLQNNGPNNSQPSASTSASLYNNGYLIKFLNSGCLVFKVGFCKPYVYSILYSIEGERFNNSNLKLNMTTFLDELDNIKVTMHLHSFTYDYHLRSMYSYISGRQLTFSPGYHLISFLDDFRKYYQKAPNYARNHILSGEVNVTNIRVSGQQLYNYIVTHNSAYNMEVLEMSNSIMAPNLLSDLSSRTFIDDQKLDSLLKDAAKNALAEIPNLSRNHANDYVLIELKREKVRYRDGKDPDIFDCGLLITHDYHQTNLSLKNSITLRYFLLLTNQRDLYPKLIHTYDNIISLGCHRPIRFGLNQMGTNNNNPPKVAIKSDKLMISRKNNETSVLDNSISDTEDIQSSEFQSSIELSGSRSMISTGNSIPSTSSGVQFNLGLDNDTVTATKIEKDELSVLKVKMNESINPADNVDSRSSTMRRSNNNSATNMPVLLNENNSLSNESSTTATKISSNRHLSAKRKRINSTGSRRSQKNKNNNYHDNERTICDEEITYLGYFSFDEMDVLKFLQQKTDNLKKHIEHIVSEAEVHYRRDYLWHKLMQRNALNAKSDEISITADELCQLLTIVEAIDLSLLDPDLIIFKTMHINWYHKLLRAFTDLKQSSVNQHRIYTIKASKLLLLYIDPNCTTALILISIDQEKGAVEMNMLLKDKQECTKLIDPSTSKAMNYIELDQDCQQLINDFINFCAAFMWSTFLN